MRQRFFWAGALPVLLAVGCGISKPSWLPGGGPKPQPPVIVQPAKTNTVITPPPTTVTNTNTVVTPPPAGTNTVVTPPVPPVNPPVVGAQAANDFNNALKAEAEGRLTDAVALYQQAANQNLPQAQYQIGYMYYAGDGIQRNDAMAAAWLKKAADQGLAQAQMMMGVLYSNGRGVPQSFVLAAQWYTKAAEQQYAQAQYYLAYLYVVGQGVPADENEASNWFLRAAENGVVDAQHQIGVRLARGEGIDQDVIEGYKWLNIASFKNHEGAKKARADLIRHMNPAQVQEAQTRTGDYVRKQKSP